MATKVENIGWTCEDCGLVHNHDKCLHQLWDIDGLDWEWIKHKMEYNPACNCGAMETKKALEEGKLFGFVTEEAADTIRRFNAPVPRETEKKIEQL